MNRNAKDYPSEVDHKFAYLLIVAQLYSTIQGFAPYYEHYSYLGG